MHTNKHESEAKNLFVFIPVHSWPNDFYPARFGCFKWNPDAS